MSEGVELLEKPFEASWGGGFSRRDPEGNIWDVAWARVAGLFNACIELTPNEVRRLQEDLERLLEPLTNRAADDRPVDASPVRIVAYFLPEPG